MGQEKGMRNEKKKRNGRCMNQESKGKRILDPGEERRPFPQNPAEGREGISGS